MDARQPPSTLEALNDNSRESDVGKARGSAKSNGAFAPAIFSTVEWHELIDASGLSPRQAEIVGLLMQSRPCREIIATLGISESTFRTQLDRAKVRLAARDRVELIYRLFWIFRQEVEPKRHPWRHRGSNLTATTHTTFRR